MLRWCGHMLLLRPPLYQAVSVGAIHRTKLKPAEAFFARTYARPCVACVAARRNDVPSGAALHFAIHKRGQARQRSIAVNSCKA